MIQWFAVQGRDDIVWRYDVGAAVAQLHRMPNGEPLWEPINRVPPNLFHLDGDIEVPPPDWAWLKLPEGL